ncbi:hypothetical protein Tco_0683238 [Tanacetum coccineum]|uniref:Uncharacterized protein n=1 Tax=Tanacetum coccineum TaxID=301880 RepID=A0ABQ4XVB7_9ASTR
MKSRNRVNSYAARITKMIADIEDRHHGPIDIEQVAVSSSLRLLEPKRTIESRAKRSSINLVRTQHPSETMVVHNEDGNPARANIKQALGYLKDGEGDGNSQLLKYQDIPHTKQGMSFAEVEQIIAQRVANAIETIAIYETKTRMAHESMNQIKQQEGKIAEDTNDKRKWKDDRKGNEISVSFGS